MAKDPFDLPQLYSKRARENWRKYGALPRGQIEALRKHAEEMRSRREALRQDAEKLRDRMEAVRNYLAKMNPNAFHPPARALSDDDGPLELFSDADTPAPPEIQNTPPEAPQPAPDPPAALQLAPPEIQNTPSEAPQPTPPAGKPTRRNKPTRRELLAKFKTSPKLLHTYKALLEVCPPNGRRPRGSLWKTIFVDLEKVFEKRGWGKPSMPAMWRVNKALGNDKKC